MTSKKWLAMTAGSVFAMAAMTTTAFAASTSYTVKPGDTFYKIAKAHHQPMSVLQAINAPKAATLFPGETIRLATSYKVKAGDSVWKIAHASHVSESDIIRWNHLTHPASIQAGSTLWLGVTQSAMAAPGAAHVSHSTGNADLVPTVRKDVAPPAPAQVSGSEVVAYAKNFLGTPYKWGGTSASGFDCSGFVKTVYDHFNIALPRTAADQHRAGSSVSKSSLQPGDLVFFDTTGSTYSHVGIYVGNGQFISATSSHGVAIEKLDNPYYWGPRYTGAIDPLS